MLSPSQSGSLGATNLTRHPALAMKAGFADHVPRLGREADQVDRHPLAGAIDAAGRAARQAIHSRRDLACAELRRLRHRQLLRLLRLADDGARWRAEAVIVEASLRGRPANGLSLAAPHQLGDGVGRDALPREAIDARRLSPAGDHESTVG